MQIAPHQLLGQRLQGFHKCTATSRRPLRTVAAAKQGTDASGDIKNARLARILRQYDAAEQQADLDAYVSQRNERLGEAEEGASRVLRASAGSRAELGPREQAELDRHMPRRGDGIREPNYGLHGGGEEQWWALHVRPGREGQVSEGLERVVLTLPPLPPAEEGGEERPRTFSVWAPRKQIKAWNPKTGKMGNKVLRFPQKYTELAAGQGSGWGYVFIRAVLDNELYRAVQFNPSVINWGHASTFTDWGAGDRERAVHRFPKPCPLALLDEAKDWELDESPVEEAEVRAAIEASQPKPDPAAVARFEEEERRAEAEEAAAQEEWARGRGRGRRDSRDGGRDGWRERGARFEGRDEGEGRRSRRFGDAGSGGVEEGRGGSWFEGGGGGGSFGERERGNRGSYRERQGAGLYAASREGSYGRREGGYGRREGGFEQREGGYDRREGGYDRREGGFERREGGFERREGGFERREGGFERREGGFERREGGFERREGGYERREGGFKQREGGFKQREGGFEQREGGYERRQRGERFGGDRQGRRDRDRGSWAEGTGEGRRQAPRDGGRDAGASRGDAGAGWYGGGAVAEPDSAWGAAAAGAAPSEDGFAGWFDSAAAALGGADPAAGGGAGGGWTWDAALGQQAGGVDAAAPGQEGPPAGQEAPLAGSPSAVDLGDVWGQQPAGDLGWLDAPAGGAAAFGFPAATPRQQEQRGRRNDRGEGRSRFDGGERRGSGERGERRGRFDGGDGGERRGRFDGERSERRGRADGGERGERRGRFDGDDRGERQGRRGGERGGGDGEGGWYAGGRSTQSGSQGGADLSWWDADSPADEGGFAGVYSGSADWEGGRQPDEPAAGRDGGRGGGRRRGADAGGGDAAAAAEGAAAAAAAFQPGQAVAVTSGNFRDFEGKVVAAEGGKVTAELDIFGKRTRVDLSPGDLAPASGDGGTGSV